MSDMVISVGDKDFAVELAEAPPPARCGNGCRSP